MKKTALFIFGLVVFTITASFGQGKSISREKKVLVPYVTSNSDTIRIDDEIMLLEGTGTNGQFLYVQLLNGFNEPIKPADSRVASQKQKIIFFKEQEGVTYLFTKFFVVNVESALNKKEIKLLKKK